MLQSNYRSTIILVVILLVIFLSMTCSYNLNPREIDFNASVKPIINKHCVACHGGVKQNGGLSLISRAEALRPNDSGYAAIVPGRPEQSEMIRRIESSDEDERMPHQLPQLEREEISLLKAWVKQGAKWGIHWSYQPFSQDVFQGGIANSINSRANGLLIDHHIEETLNHLRIKKNSIAPKSELLRRLSLAITGLPPDIEMSEAFVERNELSYEEVVDQYLEKKEFGEKWASMWLDIARYADSKGYERDDNRSIWRYRDYVIQSLNDDKPYDQFILEQLAGDLLDNPSEEQLIATGFHRNTTTNDEGGTNNEEFRVKAVIDRVSTTWEGLMGTTMACVQCHGHPYDPISHDEFYQSMAFLNNTRDADTHADYPRLNFLDSLDKAKLKSLKSWIAQQGEIEKSDEIENFVRTVSPVIYSIETNDLKNAALYDTKYLGLRKSGSAKLDRVYLEANSVLLIRGRGTMNGGLLTLHVDSRNGKEIARKRIQKTTNGYEIFELEIKPVETGYYDLVFVYENSNLKSFDEPGVFMDWIVFKEPFIGAGTPDYSKYKNQYFELISKWHDHTLILIENSDKWNRSTFKFDRGNWQVPLNEVSGDVPDILPPLKTDNPDRLAFAKWVASVDNPLTSRTFVNRVWEQLFGHGIVATTEDFGSQGSPPTHPVLLNELSAKWMHKHNWSTKLLIKEIVMSEAFRRSARLSDELKVKDPENVYYARGPRFRLSAEQIRDQALKVSGLLNSKMFGPPVMPYQPDNIWQIPYSSARWKISEGDERYRRGIYTFVKRSGLYPSMETFDSAVRQVCESRRIRTNTPLQALVTLNDPVFVETAEALADRMNIEGGEDINQQIEFAYYLGMSKKISDEKMQTLVHLYQSSKDVSDDLSDQCSDELGLRTVATAILNLDEFLTN